MKRFVSLLLTLPFFAACSSFVDDTVASDFTAATFNLRLAPTPESNAWRQRKDGIAKLVKAYKFDIFGTQEGFKHQLDYIAENTGMKYIGVARDDGKEKGEYAAVFYNPDKFELVQKGDFWFAEDSAKPVKGWDAMCRRVCSWGEFKIRKNGKKFYFFSLHFDHKGKIARKNSALMIASKAREIAGSQPYIVVGDFNAEPDSEPMRIIFKTGAFKDAFASTLTPPVRCIKGEAVSREWNGTFHNYTGKPEFDRIDYILVSPQVDALSYRVIEDKIADLGAVKEPNNDKRQVEYPSDHFPISVLVGLK